jgi:uncharacterized protein YbcI
MSKGQIEDKISKLTTKFYLENIGIGPQKIKTYILEDMVIIRTQGKLFPLEQNILTGAKGIALVKDIRKTFHEVAVSKLISLIEEFVHLPIISTHTDISTKTGESVVIFVFKENLENQIASLG